jgi:hypothetical protein
MQPKFAKPDNWENTIKDYKDKALSDKSLTLKSYCNQNNLNYATFTRNNAKMRALQMPMAKVNAIKTVIKEEVQKNLVEQAKLQLQSHAFASATKVGQLLEAKDEGIQAKAAFGILDRVGLAPAQDKTVVNVAAQINIALFPETHKKELEDMLG